MKRAITFMRLTTISAIAAMVAMTPSHANVFEDFWNVFTDPIKIGKASHELSATVERTLTQLQAMEGLTNGHATERLDQIRSILKEVIAGNQATVDAAERDMLAVEAQVDRDAIDLVYQAKCAAKETLDEGRRAFADVTADLGRANPGLYVFGLRIFDLRAKNIQIDDPDQAYRNLKKRRLEQLASEVNDSSSAYDILSTYANLQRMAKLTLCSYQDQASKIVWAREISDMERLSIPWTTIVLPSL